MTFGLARAVFRSRRYRLYCVVTCIALLLLSRLKRNNQTSFGPRLIHYSLFLQLPYSYCGNPLLYICCRARIIKTDKYGTQTTRRRRQVPSRILLVPPPAGLSLVSSCTVLDPLLSHLTSPRPITSINNNPGSCLPTYPVRPCLGFCFCFCIAFTSNLTDSDNRWPTVQAPFVALFLFTLYTFVCLQPPILRPYSRFQRIRPSKSEPSFIHRASLPYLSIDLSITT